MGILSSSPAPGVTRVDEVYTRPCVRTHRPPTITRCSRRTTPVCTRVMRTDDALANLLQQLISSLSSSWGLDSKSSIAGPRTGLHVVARGYLVGTAHQGWRPRERCR